MPKTLDISMAETSDIFVEILGNDSLLFLGEDFSVRIGSKF